MLKYVRGVLYLIFAFGVIAHCNAVMLACLPLYWISLPLYRQITEYSGRHLWPWLIFTLERLGQYKITIYGDEIPMNNESAFLILNHQFWCDFICAMFVAYHKDMLGSVKGFAKESILYIPVVGTALKAMGFVFLNRNWNKDKNKLVHSFSSLKRSGTPFWLFTHPEGGRLSPQRLIEAHDFAEKRNLPKLDNVLLPRVKGFSTTIEAIEDTISAVYDLTIAYSKPPPSIPQISTGPWYPVANPERIDIFVRRFPISSLPKTEVDLQQWLVQLYQQKDVLLSHWKKTGQYPDAIPVALFPEKDLTFVKVLWHYVQWFVVVCLPVAILGLAVFVCL